MKIAFIGDIVGRPGRVMIEQHLKKLRAEYEIDFVIANYENASHGFGLTSKNADELFKTGIDVMTGGNHTFDKREIFALFDSYEILRPHNYPDIVPGTGMKVYDVNGEKLAVLNVMGHYGMPYVDNAFRCADDAVTKLHEENITNIFVDIHAEATSEKRGMMMLLEGRVSAICGTHTHVSSDDLQIANGTGYLSDIGLTGCRDNVIGMDKKTPLDAFFTGIKGHFDIPKNCKKILQMVIYDIKNGKCEDAFKVKVFDDNTKIVTKGWIEK
ncbi:TIGR00282 family metallophosphoesterase [Sulfurimonas sp. HSL3-2]|uniref:TIGR00282 family metallophosphoesterase n=1 Tax=Hydrocurvibacter mobilis TaxID=3131936 RepID=UPI0031F98D6E